MLINSNNEHPFYRPLGAPLKPTGRVPAELAAEHGVAIAAFILGVAAGAMLGALAVWAVMP